MIPGEFESVLKWLKEINQGSPIRMENGPGENSPSTESLSTSDISMVLITANQAEKQTTTSSLHTVHLHA